MAPSFYIPKRYILVLFGNFGFFMIFALRVNLSVALVAMVNATFSHADGSVETECGKLFLNNSKEEKNENGEFNWDQKQQGVVLGSFYYGYLFTQIPGGWLASKYGGKHVFGVGVLTTSVLTLLTPIAARANIYLLAVVRILQGIGEGVSQPAMQAIMSRWSPPNERSRMINFVFAGNSIGVIVALPISGLLANSKSLGGWPSVFYVFGVLGILWFVAWTRFVYSSPDEHPYISQEEKNYINVVLEECSFSKKVEKVPWWQVFTSIRVWAIVIASFTNDWVWTLVLIGLPSYFSQVLNLRLEENGFLSTLPSVVALMIGFSGPVLADYLIKNHHLSIKQTRRLMESLAFYPAALCLAITGYTGCNQNGLAIACMTLSAGFMTFNGSGHFVNPIDISPRFSGVIFGIANTAGSIASSIAPLLTGYLTNHRPTRENYHKVFLIASGLSVIGGTFFNVFVSGKQQTWNHIDEDSPRKTRGCSNQGMELEGGTFQTA